MAIIEGAVERGQLVENPGVEFHVDGDSGVDTRSGSSWPRALATIQEAVDRCVSGRHDRVYVKTAAAAYDENVVVTSKDYVSIIGVGNSAWGRPDIHPASGVGLAVSLSQGFHGERIYVFSDDVDALTIDSEGWQLQDVKCQGASDGLFLKGNADDDSYGAGQGLAINSMFEACGAAGVRMEHAEAPSGIGAWGNRFTRCGFRDNTGADFLSAVAGTGGNAGIFLALGIDGCRFYDLGAAHVYLDMDQGNGLDLAANQALITANWFADEAIIASQIAISGQPNVVFAGNYDSAGLINGAAFND
jgi:hypothetical protein